MNVITNPKTKLLSEGKSFIAKEMVANAGVFLPKHLASTETVLVVQKGVCVIHFEEEDHILNQDDVFIVPANTIHQIETKQEFTAVHLMPKVVKFEFLK